MKRQHLRAWLPRIAVLAATLAALLLSTTRLRLSADLSALFPDEERSRVLSQYVRVFGGGDVGLLLVKGERADEVTAFAADVTSALRGAPSVAGVVDHAPAAEGFDPTLAWRYAGPSARRRLAETLTEEGMLARLAETRTLLLAPGASSLEDTLARDPLRLAQVPFEGRTELAAGVRAEGGDPFAADHGRARLVVVLPRGNAFDAGAAAAFVDDVERSIAAVRERHPAVRASLGGGHAVARATERMLRRDLVLSGVLSVALSAVLFLVTFRRVRALAAVLPPLLLGTLWTTGLAGLFFPRLSAIATAFAAVVVGVGVDTGVHVYGALLDARRNGQAPAEAARLARRRTLRPTLVAATLASVAFASLAWTDLRGMLELGILSAAGELLTAIAILLVTPEIGAWLERGPAPAEDPAVWTAIPRLATSTKRRAAATLAVFAVLGCGLAWQGWPKAGDQLVVVRPTGLAPMATIEEIYTLFGGRPGQWVVVSRGKTREEAESHADAIAEALEGLADDGTIDGYDSATPFTPSETAQRQRLRARDALDLPSLRPRLERALVETGFDLEACAPALAAFSAPSHAIAPVPAATDPLVGWIVARHLREDRGEALAVTYVRARGEAALDARAATTIRAADPSAVLTGYQALDQDLRTSLVRDLPRVGLVALLLVAIGLRASLGSMRDVAIALVTLAAEIAMLGLAMRVLGVRWHVYDALVVPVLLGITIDESMFLLFAAREHGSLEETLRVEGPRVAATALTTAAGFGALVVCRFEGLRDLGAVGAIGSIAGLLSALFVVPAGLRWAKAEQR